MHILMTGGTGLIGQAIIKAGLLAGHHFTLWVRNYAKASRLFGQKVAYIDSALQLLHLDTVDWVINLAGEPIADQRWRTHRKHQLLASRLQITRALASWINQQTNRELVFLSGSATGIYGDTGTALVDENTPLEGANDFASNLCQQWEAEANSATRCRKIVLRTGLVLSAQGGLLQRLKPVFTWGLGGKLGAGRQYMPWIHIDDYVAALFYLGQQPGATGSFNLCAPNPVSNEEFTRTLAALLHRPAWLHLPSPVLKVLLGELSQLLLTGQRARPARLLDAGFAFGYPQLSDALAMLLCRPQNTIARHT